MGRTLTGLAWDHRRCWGPLDASVPIYSANHPGLTISWDRRSLYEFGEGRLEDAVRNYDLVVLDHPFIGDVAREGLLVPFDAYLSDANRKAFAAESVGRSWESYQANGLQWALPIDAAAQVASYRPDLLDRIDGALPRTHGDVVALGHKVRRQGKWLGLPLVPTDAMCLILTGAAVAGHPVAPAEEVFLAEGALAEILDRLRELAGLAHPDSWSWNPIRCYDHMIAHDDVVYVPFAFGYVNYASRGEAQHLRFADIPASPPTGSLLGGAGIGISAFAKERDAAAEYALYLCSPEFQRTEYVKAGGQPGTLSAWTDAGVNRATSGFFRDTLATLQGSYLRGTYPGFVGFFRAGAPKAAAAIRGELSARELAAWFNRKHSETSRGALDRSLCMSDEVEALLADASVDAVEAARPAYKAPAADKALDILEFMADRPDGVTQTEISAGVGRSIHEIYRIIQLLEKRGYLVRAARSDRYRLSLKLFELAHKHPPVNRLIDVALPVMRRLAAGSDQSCHLVILRDLQVLIILQVDSPLPMRYSVALGSQFPILETSSGAVLLANLPARERAGLIERLRASEEAAGEDLAARLAGIDAAGFEMRPSLAVDGCINISLPIRDHTDTTVAALTVPYLPQKHARFDRNTVLGAAQAAALEISRGLGAAEDVLSGSASNRR